MCVYICTFFLIFINFTSCFCSDLTVNDCYGQIGCIVILSFFHLVFAFHIHLIFNWICYDCWKYIDLYQIISIHLFSSKGNKASSNRTEIGLLLITLRSLSLSLPYFERFSVEKDSIPGAGESYGSIPVLQEPVNHTVIFQEPAFHTIFLQPRVFR